MQSSKLLKLLKLLNKEECRRFKKMLQSPFFTANKHLVKIYDYLIKGYPEFASPKLDKALVFAHLFPKIKYNDNKLRMLLREFTRQLEDFLIIKEVRENEEARKKQLVHIYGQRNQMELFKKGTFQLLEEMEAMPIKDKNHFFEQQQLIQELVYHPATSELKERYSLQLDMMENLEIHYWTNKVWLSCNLLSIQKFLEVEYAIKDLAISAEKLPKKYFEKHPPLDTYIKSFQFLKSPSPSHYFEFKSAYLNNLNKMKESDQRDLFSYALNYSILQHNQGNFLFSKESFEWLKFGLNNQFLIESNRIDDSIFTNTCLLALRLDAINWADQFIKTYEIYLDKSNKKDTIKLCEAYILFYEKKYLHLITFLKNYKFKHFKDILRIKSLLLRSYFELFLEKNSYFNIFLSYSYSYEKFIRRDEMSSKIVIETYINLIDTTRKIAKLIKEGKWNSDWKSKIKEKIKGEKIILKQWLLEKLNS